LGLSKSKSKKIQAKAQSDDMKKEETSTSKINCSRKTQSNSTDIWEQNYCDERAATYGGSGVLLEVIMGRESKAQ
jgi:hypothetical protein